MWKTLHFQDLLWTEYFQLKEAEQLWREHFLTGKFIREIGWWSIHNKLPVQEFVEFRCTGSRSLWSRSEKRTEPGSDEQRQSSDGKLVSRKCDCTGRKYESQPLCECKLTLLPQSKRSIEHQTSIIFIAEQQQFVQSSSVVLEKVEPGNQPMFNYKKKSAAALSGGQVYCPILFTTRDNRWRIILWNGDVVSKISHGVLTKTGTAWKTIAESRK